MPGLLDALGAPYTPGLQLVDPACPVNWAHPLTYSLAMLLRVVANPGWSGGLAFRDLTRGGHSPNDGTLTGVGVNSGFRGPRGRLGGAGSWLGDGTAGYVQVPNSPQINNTLSPLTWAAWALTKTTASQVAFSNRTSTNTNGTFLSLNGTNHPVFQAQGTTTLNHNSSTVLTIGTWYHLALAWDGSTTAANARIYINGAETSYATTTNGAALNSPTGNPLWIGRRGDLLQLWNGNLDELVQWNRALTAAEVASWYQSSLAGHPELLNYLGTTAYSFPSAGGSTVSATGTAFGYAPAAAVAALTSASGAASTGYGPATAVAVITSAASASSVGYAPAAASAVVTVNAGASAFGGNTATATGALTVTAAAMSFAANTAAATGALTIAAAGTAPGNSVVYASTSSITIVSAAGSAFGYGPAAGTGALTASAPASAFGATAATAPAALTARASASAFGVSSAGALGAVTVSAPASAAGAGLAWGSVQSPVVPVADVGWSAADPGRTWLAADPGRTWLAADPGRTWRGTDPMNVVTIEKLSDWDRNYFFDFSGFGEFAESPPQTIATVLAVAVIAGPAGLTVGAGSVSGLEVVAGINGGTAGQEYTLRCQVRTAGGKTLSQWGSLLIVG